MRSDKRYDVKESEKVRAREGGGGWGRCEVKVK